MKRTKNIFNSLIAHQNLLESEGSRQNKIGALSIGSNWLTDIPSEQYRAYITSALQLSELQKQLNQLKENDSSPRKETNLFRIGKTKKKIDHLSLQLVEDQKPLQQALAKNQPPQTQDLVLQKMTQGFFKSLLERKCKIQQKQLFRQSLKEGKSQWIPLGIVGYTLQLQQKQKPQNKQEFKQFQWINGFKERIILWAPQKKPICVYGKEENLRKFQRYFQVENLQVKKLDIFGKLDSQLRQKIITLFGNKIRFYDHSFKVRRAERQAQIDSFLNQKEPNGKHKNIMDQAKDKQKQKSSQIGQSSQVGMSSDLSQSGLLESQALLGQAKTPDKIIAGSINLASIKGDNKRRFSDQKKADGQTFKLKLKSSVVFYNQMSDPIQFNNNEQEIQVQDLKLNLREEIGISDVDEESERGSGTTFRRDSTKKKVRHMTLRNVLDNSQQFNINIFEASSQGQNQSTEKQNNQVDLEVPPLNKTSSNLLSNFLRDSNILNPDKLTIKQQNNIDFDADFFELQKARPNEMEESFLNRSLPLTPIAKKQNQNIVSQVFKKKKIGEIEIVQNPRSQQVYFTIEGINMFSPYHSQTLEFQIIQIDLELQMQGKIVVCGRGKGTLQQKRDDYEKYMCYRKKDGYHFRFFKDFQRFMFVLVEQSKCHYIKFEIDTHQKYQRNFSQLLISKLDKEGYPFAACLLLHVSPNPIKLKPMLGTVQFMQKYLNEGQDYDFKHDFIEGKKRIHMVKRQWHNIAIAQTVSQCDDQGFAHAIYYGLNEPIFANLKKRVKYDPKKLFIFTQNQYRMMEENIVTGLIDLKSFLKPYTLLKEVTQSNYNDSLKQRIEHVYVYFLYRYGSIRNLALIFVKQILQKLQPILILCRKQEEVSAIFKLYFEVEYQIDELFLSMSAFFKK